MTTIENLSDEILKELENYSETVTVGVKKAVDVVAKEVDTEIKSHVTFKEPTGKYVKAFRIKTTENSTFNRGKTWHVANGQYRLTHLLENGHALKYGGRAKSFPHIKYGEELAIKRMEELTKKAIEDA